MNRIHAALILTAAIAIPAVAYSSFTPKAPLCFASGATTYRIAPAAAAADFRIKIATDTDHADLRMQLVDRAELADFVLVDDFSGGEPASCRSSTPIQTVSLADGSTRPDVTVRLSADGRGADYRIYIQSARYSQQDAAALLAAMWKTEQRREVTASIARR